MILARKIKKRYNEEGGGGKQDNGLKRLMSKWCRYIATWADGDATKNDNR